MKKSMILSILGLVFGLLIIIALSIWMGFPKPQGFNREYIGLVGYLIGIALTVGGFAGLMIINDWY